MIKLSRATDKENLGGEWQKFTVEKYGKGAIWLEKSYRFKAVVDGKILGTIEGKYEPGVLYISALMITPEARGKGIGRLLINKAEDFAKKLGGHRTWLITGKNWSNRSFYEKLGFQKTADLADFFFHQDFVVYTKLIK